MDTATNLANKTEDSDIIQTFSTKKITIEKAKQVSVHSGLMEIMCIAALLRDKIYLAKYDKQLMYDDWPDILDAMQTELNEFKANISQMIGNLIISAVDDIMNPDGEASSTSKINNI